MRQRLLSLLSNSKGRGITWASSAVVALVVGQLAKYGLEITPDNQAWLTATLTAGLAALVDGWTNSNTGAGVGRIQTQLQALNPAIRVDEWAGDVTVSTVAALIQRKEELERAVEALEQQKKEMLDEVGRLTI